MSEARKSENVAGMSRELWESPFMRACRREQVPYTPVWLMRQAGRYMKEYRDVRTKHSFLEMCKKPEVAAEVTVYAAHRLGFDAAIIFADILLIIEPMGLELEFAKGEGPVIHNPVRTAADVERVREVEDVSSLHYVYEAVRLTRRELRPDLPLIGFCGAPFTLASYICEGGGSKNYINTKRLMYTDAGAWRALMSRIARALSQYLNAQIDAGAQAVQIFDSWVGALSPDDYREYVLPHTREVIENVTPGVPVIHFGTGTATLLELQKEAGGDVIGPESRMREVAHHYELFGGVSPINGQNRRLIAALERELEEQGPRLPVYWGNRNWHPLLADTLRRMRDDGVRNALAFVTSAYSSYSGCRQYRENVERAREEVGEGAPEVLKLRAFYNHPGFVGPNVLNLRAALEQIPAARRAAAEVAFTA